MHNHVQCILDSPFDVLETRPAQRNLKTHRETYVLLTYFRFPMQTNTEPPSMTECASLGQDDAQRSSASLSVGALVGMQVSQICHLSPRDQ